MGTVINYPEQRLTRRIIGAAIEVHRTLGPGLLESAYQACLARERVGFSYKGCEIDCAYRADMVVEGAVLLELKCSSRDLI